MLRPALLIVLASIGVGAQAPAPPARLLEVISVRPLPPDARGGRALVALPGGHFVARRVPVGMLVNAVYRFPPERIVGAPKWYDTQFFDIEGRGSWKERPTDAVYRQIIQQVLVERFRLKAHIEQRPAEVYALVLARRDGRLGPGLRRSGDECVKRLAAELDFPPAGFPAPGQRPACGIHSSMKDGVMRMRLGSTHIAKILSAAQAELGGLTVDGTGLQGLFDVELDYVPASAQASAPGQEHGRAAPNGPSFTTALREQLGLRFEKRKEPADVLVIDHVEMPAPN